MAYLHETHKDIYDMLNNPVKTITQDYTGAKDFTCEQGHVFRASVKLVVNGTQKCPFCYPTTSVTCLICRETLSRLEHLDRHHNSVHEQKESYECSVCHKMFADESSRNRHEKIHGEREECKCGTCGKILADKGSLQKHEDAHKGILHACTVPGCTRVYKHKSGLSAHKNTHKN